MNVLYCPNTNTFIVPLRDSGTVEYRALPGNYLVDYCPDAHVATVSGHRMPGPLYWVECSDFRQEIKRNVVRGRGHPRSGNRVTVNIANIDKAGFQRAVEQANQQILQILVSQSRYKNQCES